MQVQLRTKVQTLQKFPPYFRGKNVKIFLSKEDLVSVKEILKLNVYLGLQFQYQILRGEN